MNWIIYLILFLFFLVILILLSKIKINILINKEKNNDFVNINFWLVYFFHIEKNIPLIIFENLHEGIKYQSETTYGNAETYEKKDRITYNKLSVWRQKFNQILNNINDFNETIKWFLKHVSIDNIQWNSVVGTGDAMYTGVLSGGIWGIKSNIITLISRIAKLKNLPQITIEADFHRVVYKSRFQCILRFRLGYVILTGIRILYKLNKGGWKDDRRSSYTRLDANGHGKFKGNG